MILASGRYNNTNKKASAKPPMHRICWAGRNPQGSESNAWRTLIFITSFFGLWLLSHNLDHLLHLLAEILPVIRNPSFIQTLLPIGIFNYLTFSCKLEVLQRSCRAKPKLTTGFFSKSISILALRQWQLCLECLHIQKFRFNIYLWEASSLQTALKITISESNFITYLIKWTYSLPVLNRWIPRLCKEICDGL